jgi:hypothetical protein
VAEVSTKLSIRNTFRHGCIIPIVTRAKFCPQLDIRNGDRNHETFSAFRNRNQTENVVTARNIATGDPWMCEKPNVTWLGLLVTNKIYFSHSDSLVFGP